MNTRGGSALTRQVGALLALSGCLVLSGCAGQNRPLQLLSGAGAVYPTQAEARGIQGFVTLQYDVGIDGRVSNVLVVGSEPDGVFDAAARQALQQWRFAPAVRDGQAVAQTGLESTISFKLEDLTRYEQYD